MNHLDLVCNSIHNSLKRVELIWTFYNIILGCRQQKELNNASNESDNYAGKKNILFKNVTI